MKRKAIDELIKWKESNKPKPVLITGAKGVGKTYLAYDFAKAFFKHINYIQFQRDPLLKSLFIPSDVIETNKRFNQHFLLNEEEPKEARILILDEISYCEDALKTINTGCLSELFEHIICISSNPISDELSKKMLHIPVRPLEFDEFLRATGNEWYIDLIRTHFYNNRKLPDIVHKELLELHRLYLEIGGIPTCVNEFLSLSSPVNIYEQHNFLFGSYHNYIQRDNLESDALKMNQVLESIPHQLMKENKKFQYTLIRKGTTHSMYKEAIQNLTNLNYVIRCNRINNDILTLNEELKPELIFQDPANVNFKLYYLDTGMLYSKIKEEYDVSANVNFARALLENYVAQSLLAKQYQIAFWESDSMAKIDFIIHKDKVMLPIELHDDSNTRSKSLSVFKQKYDFPYAIKISSKNFEMSKNIKYIPYYAVFCI